MNFPADSLRALVSNLIDYAGLFPPASLSLEETFRCYEQYRGSEHAWMLNRLVLPLKHLGGVPPQSPWRVSLLADALVPASPGSVEMIETRTALPFGLPVYRELPIEDVRNGFVKVRTGAVTAAGIPSAGFLADFLFEAAKRKLPFKATAGLHHPLRSEQALTYEPDSPRAIMHGFVNVFSAAAFAWDGAERELLRDLLLEEDASAFRFETGGLAWRGRAISTSRIEASRRDFAHSFGSCSFTEPVNELRELGWIA